MLVFMSTSGVTSFFEELRRKHITVDSSIPLACIGQMTADAVRKEIGRAEIVASESCAEALAEAIIKYGKGK